MVLKVDLVQRDMPRLMSLGGNLEHSPSNLLIEVHQWVSVISD